MAAQRLAYYDYIANGGETPSIVVIQDLDDQPGYGAFWGEVNSAIHLGLGCQGCVTNGSFRDLEDWAPGFQMLGGRIGPSHAFVHLVDFGGEVTVHGMTAQDGDIIHADRRCPKPSRSVCAAKRRCWRRRAATGSTSPN